MTKTIHTIYIMTMVGITIMVTLYLVFHGYEYYQLPLEERFYNEGHDFYKPSGTYGHGLGIVGTLMILFGVSIYIARKRYNFLVRFIRLKYLLEFHIFLCTLGPILILFHTAFKFGGIVSIAFWSMVAVVLSGVIGRFIYIQIPRTIEGRALNKNELQKIRTDMAEELKNKESIGAEVLSMIRETSITEDNSDLDFFHQFLQERKIISRVRGKLQNAGLPPKAQKEIIKTVKKEISLSHRIRRLQKMQSLFKYWHVAHLPFALIMLIIVVIHVGITLAFGYKWIF